MGVFCDWLKLGSTAALDCQTGQKTKADIAKKSASCPWSKFCIKYHEQTSDSNNNDLLRSQYFATKFVMK
jgi:hypothetical protein